MTKTWCCSVCGDLHQGEVPPATCPVCHVDAEKFALTQTEGDAAAVESHPGLLRERIDAVLPHAVFSHVPNALIPTTVLFCGLFLLFSSASFETTAFYLLLVAVLSVPATFATGRYDWKTSYGGDLSEKDSARQPVAYFGLACSALALAGPWLID